MKTVSLSVARDYSRTPGARYRWQGPFSGEEFRDYLAIKLQDAEKIVIDLDGTRGFGSSFLEEAFGGLVRIARQLKLDKNTVIHRIEIVSNQDPTYRQEAMDAMTAATPE
jgi:hypothetical protein